MQSAVKERQIYLDILRILATFAVIFIHVSGRDFIYSYKAYDWYVSDIYNSISRWAVPIFVMISGTLFLNPNKDVPIKAILTKYIPRILIAYLFWWFCYSAYSGLTHYIESGVVTSKSLRPNIHLWFLPMLMCMYLLVPLFRKVVIDKKVLKYALALWVGYATISFVFGTFEIHPKIHQIMDLFRGDIILVYAGYFLLGYYMSTTELRKKTRSVIYLLGLLGAALTITGSIIMSLLKGEPNQLFLMSRSPFIIMMASALFVCIKYNVKDVGPKTGKFIAHVRKDLFGIYLVHGFYLKLFNTDLFCDMCNHIITIPIITLLVFIASLYTTKLLRLIPLLRKTVE